MIRLIGGRVVASSSRTQPTLSAQSAKARVSDARLRMCELLDLELYDDALRFALERECLGPFGPDTGRENVPPHIFELLHALFDEFALALEQAPRNSARARRACDHMGALVDRMM